MNDILTSLYNCAMESRSKHFLTGNELRDYKSALRSEEKLKGELEQILEGEPLRLFELYADNKDDEGGISNISSFRKGLAMGLKLGAFGLLQR